MMLLKSETLGQIYMISWQHHMETSLNRETNKLTIYRLIRTKFVSQPYLEMPITGNERKALAQIRCGIAPLRLETDRREESNNIQPLSDGRVCLIF